MRSAAVLVGVLAAACTRAPPQAVAGLYAVKAAGTVTRGEAKKPVTRRARAGMTLTTEMTLALDAGGAVLECFDGSFRFLDSGKHPIAALKLNPAPPEGGTRAVVWITDKSAPRELPTPVVQPRYEPVERAKPLKDPDDEELKSDVEYFFTPHAADEEKVEDPTPRTPPAPWMVKDPYVHPLRRPLKAGEGGRALVEAKGAVVVEFSDQATAFADTLKLPLDLSDVKRVVVAQGSARITLSGGQAVALKSGEVAEIAAQP